MVLTKDWEPLPAGWGLPSIISGLGIYLFFTLHFVQTESLMAIIYDIQLYMFQYYLRLNQFLLSRNWNWNNFLALGFSIIARGYQEAKINFRCFPQKKSSKLQKFWVHTPILMSFALILILVRGQPKLMFYHLQMWSKKLTILRLELYKVKKGQLIDSYILMNFSPFIWLVMIKIWQLKRKCLNSF